MEVFVNEGMKTHRNGNESELLRNKIEEKEKELRIVKK